MTAETAQVWTLAERERWSRIVAHPIEALGGERDFLSRLAQENRWSREESLAAIGEYRRYVFLAACGVDIATPSDAVDEVWHLHLQYTRDYWSVFCPDVLRCELHHEPSRGGAAEAACHRDAYARTLERYQRYFGAPPERFWPGERERRAASRQLRRVDLCRHWLLPRPRWPTGLAALRTIATLAAIGAPGLVVALPDSPFDWNGIDFLKLYLVLMLVGIVASYWLRRRALDTGEHGVRTGLSPLEIAYLGGDAVRATDVGVTELMQQHVARWDKPSNKLAIIGQAKRIGPPLDQLVVAIRADGRPNGLSSRARLFAEPLRRALVTRALAPTPEVAWRARWFAALPPMAVVLFGFAKIEVGLSRGKPVSILVFLTIAMAIFALVRFALKPLRTRAGEDALRELKSAHAATMRAPTDDNLALAVALAGTAILSTTAYADYHQARAPSGGSGDSSSGSSGGDSGSSCSGGGGCGGCGGGGGD